MPNKNPGMQVPGACPRIEAVGTLFSDRLLVCTKIVRFVYKLHYNSA
jgi:hypothetical protein